ncbi:MAG: RecQ family zinc-binding domain-containing protein, partial [Saprospiraceae bacterium]|nr:RecQ family zinc-binding domain-containing protein [Saprospiraceae bacterium]
QQRKKRAELRLEKAIQFAGTLKCRSQQLLAYFDEPESPACGICDVCTGRHKSELDTSHFAVYEKKIRDLLKHEALTMEEILQAFAPKRHEAVAQVLNYLLSEGKLQPDENGKMK